MTEPSESSRNMSNFRSSTFTELFSRLKITMLEIEDWVILQRSKFDITVDGQPYPALQLYLNSCTGVYLTRVWGKTCLKGEIIPNSLEEIRDLCDQMFGQGLAFCPGNINNDVATESSDLTSKTGAKNLISVECPFPRKVSIGCAVIHKPDGAPHDSTLVVCSECRCTVISEDKELVEAPLPIEGLNSEGIDMEISDSNKTELAAADISGPSQDDNKNKTHASDSLDEQLGRHKCPECDETFEWRHFANKHIVARHGRFLKAHESTYHLKCQMCSMIFKSNAEFERHTTLVHKEAMANMDNLRLFSNGIKESNNLPLPDMKLGHGLKEEPKLEPFSFIDPVVKEMVAKDNPIQSKKGHGITTDIINSLDEHLGSGIIDPKLKCKSTYL